MKRLLRSAGRKAVRGFFLAAILLACAGESFGPPQTKLPFGPGEKLRYSVRWRLLQAGEAELSLTQEGDSGSRWKATAKANSIGHVSNIYKVEDEYRATFHNPNFCSEGIHKTIHEGNRHREVTIQFDSQKKLALLRDRDITGATAPKQDQFATPDCVYDILSAVYYVRTLTLEVGKSIEFPVNDGARTIRVRAEVQAEEEVQTEVGKFMAFRVEPDVFSGNLFKEKGRMFVWFSKDASRIPVQLKAQIGVGTIIATLAGVDRRE